MIKKLQKNFIRIAALALLSVILIVVASINGVFLYQCNQLLDNKLENMLIRHTGKQDDARDKPQKEKAPGAEEPGKKRTTSPFDIFPLLHQNMQSSSACCVVILDSDYTIQIVRQNIEDSFSDEDLESYIAVIRQEEKDHGWYQFIKYRVIVNKDADGNEQICIAFINASPTLYSILSLLVISLIIGLATFLIILLLIIIASRRAIQPLIESYQKQHQFITDAGHELKTPLTVISANSELARMTYGDSEWFDGIDRQVQRMNKLVRELITLAKMDEQQKLDFEHFNLSDALYDVMLPFGQVLTRQEKNLTYDITDHITLKGNESSIRELISILIDNAAKYCAEQGTVHVTLHTMNNKIHLDITNDFQDAENCDFSAIFDRFYRADKSRKSDGSYGLGLSIAKNIVEMHHGTITAKAAGATKIVFEVSFKN